MDAMDEMDLMDQASVHSVQIVHNDQPVHSAHHARLRWLPRDRRTFTTGPTCDV
jgi:hypothetical protein